MLSLTINRGSPLQSREAQSHAIKETQSHVALLRWTLSSGNFSYKSPALPVKWQVQAAVLSVSLLCADKFRELVIKTLRYCSVAVNQANGLL